jgi:hypothetical protein
MVRGADGCAARKVEISDWSSRFTVGVTTTREGAPGARCPFAALELWVAIATPITATPTIPARTSSRLMTALRRSGSFVTTRARS